MSPDTRLNRRKFLALSAAATAASVLPAPSAAIFGQTPATTAPGNLRLIFFTDTHTQPELAATEGTAKAMSLIRTLKPDLCIQGGDHAFDLSAVPRKRALMLFDLYQRTEHQLDGIPIQHVLGNHDLFGRDPASKIPPSDPLYGKKAFEQRFDTRTYRSFDRAGYHFILLDSIQIARDRSFDPFIDPAQLAWLKLDLASTPSATPIVIASHVPLLSSVVQYAPPDDKIFAAGRGLLVSNAYAILPLLRGHNVIAVLQGHTHFNEIVHWHGIPFLTSGAVSGNWWHGSRWGTPEGFTVLELAAGKAQWHYESYGWHSPEPFDDPYPA